MLYSLFTLCPDLRSQRFPDEDDEMQLSTLCRMATLLLMAATGCQSLRQTTKVVMKPEQLVVAPDAGATWYRLDRTSLELDGTLSWSARPDEKMALRAERLDAKSILAHASRVDPLPRAPECALHVRFAGDGTISFPVAGSPRCGLVKAARPWITTDDMGFLVPHPEHEDVYVYAAGAPGSDPDAIPEPWAIDGMTVRIAGGQTLSIDAGPSGSELYALVSGDVIEVFSLRRS